MDTKQAKDFLAEQVAGQASLDNTPFSDAERRMIYFTESDPMSCPDPLALNDEFEGQHDTAEYEAKMSVLLQHAYQRLKAKDPEAKRTWDEAVRELRKGDHYFLVLWDIKGPSENRARDVIVMVVIGLLVVAGIYIAATWNGR
jgi:hypothetical protein